MFAATGLPFDGTNHVLYNIANVNLEEIRPKLKLIANNKIKEIKADFFFGSAFSLLRG
jgi:hypothetical protein